MLSEIKSLNNYSNYNDQIIVYRDKLISCCSNSNSNSNSNTIKIWNLKGENNELIRTLEGHNQLITYILVYQDKLISCSYDNTIKIWDLNLKGDTKPIRTLEGHNNWVTHMCYLPR